MKKIELTNRSFIGVMLVIVVAIMPLVVRGVFRVLPPESVPLLSGLDAVAELYGAWSYLNFFSYWKSWFIIVPALVIAFLYISDVVTNAGKGVNFKAIIKDPVVITSGVFLLFMMISTIFSNYTHTAWFGTYERSEGAFMWMAYFTVMFAARFYTQGMGQAKILLYGVVFSSIIMGAIGLSQFVGSDFFATSLGQRIVASGVQASEHVQGDIIIRFDFAFGTLFNPNTFGLYTAMIAPLLLIMAITYDGKKWVNALFFLGGGLMLVGVFGSRSLGGFVGLGAAVGALVVTLLATVIYRWRKGDGGEKRTMRRSDWYIIGSGAALLAAIIVAVLFVPFINERVALQWQRVDTMLRTEPRPVYDFTFQGGVMTAYLDEARLFVATVDTTQEDAAWLHIADAQGNAVSPAQIDEQETLRVYTFALPGYGNVVFSRHLASPTAFIYRGVFFVQQEGTIYAIPAGAAPLIDLSEPVPAWGFRGRERWGTNRGYIFSRTFPMMPRTFLIGSGPDSYLNVFPNHDVMGKMQHMAGPYQIVDKAHNIFLQTWITKGGIATLALLALLGHYMMATFLLLIKNAKGSSRFVYGLRLGLLLAAAAFSVAGLATDSTVGSTGVFFVLLGLGWGVNKI